MRALRGGRAEWKSLNYNLTTIKIANQRQFHIPKEISEVSATIKDLKYVHVVIPTKTQFNSPTWLVQKPGGPWRMTIGYCELRWDVNCSCGPRHDTFTGTHQHNFGPGVHL